MPTLNIEGHSVNVDDSFLKLSPDEQNKTVDEIHQSLKAEPVSANNVARSAAEGVPIVGGLLNKANAATNAALAPVLNPLFDKKDQLSEPSFGERYAHSLRDQEGMDKRFQEAHPVVDTAAKLAGGVASMVPAMGAAPAAFGLSGTVPQMVVRGAASGAGLSAADALARGEDPIHAAETGGIIGGAAGPVGRVIGKGVAAIADRIKPPPAAATRTIDVNGVQVPVRESVVTGTPDTSAEEQVILRGGRGPQAQEIATSLEDQSRAGMDQAHGQFAAGLDSRNQGLDQRLDSLAAERGGLITEAHNGAPNARVPQENLPLHDAISTAVNPGFNHDRAMASARWAMENGRPDIAQALVDRAHARASEPTGLPGVRVGHPRYEEIARNLQAIKAAEARQLAEIQQSTGLRPTQGGALRTTPEDAGQTVASELASREQARAAAEAQRLQAASNEPANLRAAMDRPPVAPAPETPHAMGEAVSTGIRGRAQTAANARTAAYDRAAAVEGEFTPSVFTRAGNAIRDRLNGGADPVRVTDRLTPNAADALNVIDEDLGHLRFEDQTRRGELTIGPDGRPVNRPITGNDVEATRKKLVQLQRAANQSARAPGGSYEDARAMRRLIDEFDSHVQRGVNAGGFSGNGQEYLARLGEARRLHAQYRQNFSAQGAGDKVGQAIESIIGKHPGQEATPDAIVKTILGSASEPGGGQTVQVAQRLRGLLGENSPEWGAIRKAMISHLTEAPAGLEAIPHDVQSDRIMNFLNGTKGRTLAHVLFSPSERAQLGTYAARLRNVTDPQPANQVERIISHISGRDGLPSSSTEVVNRLMDTKGNSAVAVQLARQLRSQLSPQSWNAVRQGMWSKLTEPAEGMIAWGPQKISQNIHNFLKSSIATELFSEQERGLMKTIASAHGQMVPVAGTTNPSGTAPMLSKIASGARHTLLPLLGFSHGGMGGAAVGLAADRALSWVGNKRSADTARRLFYGEQARRPINPNFAASAGLLAKGSTAELNQRRSSQ